MLAVVYSLVRAARSTYSFHAHKIVQGVAVPMCFMCSCLQLTTWLSPQIPQLGRKAALVAIPTTSGTGGLWGWGSEQAVI